MKRQSLLTPLLGEIARLERGLRRSHGQRSGRLRRHALLSVLSSFRIALIALPPVRTPAAPSRPTGNKRSSG